MLDDAPDVNEQFQRLLDAGFVAFNGVDLERLEDLAVDYDTPRGAGRCYPTSFRVTMRRNRVFELWSDGRLGLVSADCRAGVFSDRPCFWLPETIVR